MYTASVLSSAFLAQAFAALVVALGLGEWLALVGQLASLALLALVALRVCREHPATREQLDDVARKASAERRAIQERLESLERLGRRE